MRAFYPVILALVVALGTVLPGPAFSQSMPPEDAQRTLEALGVPYTVDAFCKAVEKDELTIFKLFHAAGADLETRCSFERTPLFIAVDFGSNKIYRYLMENNVEVLAINSAGSTPLVRAISWSRYDIVYELLRAGAPAFVTPPTVEHSLYTMNTALGYALLDCDPRLVKDLLKAHADAKQNVIPLEFGGGTALMRAVGACPSVTKILIEAGADVQVADSSGNTALHKALNTKNQSFDTIRILLEAGAKVEVANQSGYTPAFGAVLGADKYVVRLLLDRGANPNKTFKLAQDTIPFVLAGKISLIDAILNGASLLMIATGYGNLEAVKVLLEYGADADYAIKGKLGLHTAKSLAKAIERDDIAALLP